MSSTDIQLYGNNSKSTLALALGLTDTVFSVATAQGSRFPTISNSKEFFLVTLESAGVIEVCRVTSRVGDTFTVERAQEGTSANQFPAGTQVQMRITRDTLARMARLTDRLGDLDSVDDLPKVTDATGNSFLCKSPDDTGNPIVATKGADRWRFPTHSTVVALSNVAGSTTTSISSPAFERLPVVSGRYIINFLTGSLVGQSRLVTSGSGSTLSWDTATPSAPLVGVQVEVLASNAYQIQLLASLSDESIINALIFGS